MDWSTNQLCTGMSESRSKNFSTKKKTSEFEANSASQQCEDRGLPSSTFTPSLIIGEFRLDQNSRKHEI